MGTIETRSEEGWINEHDLRGEAVRTDRAQRVRFIDAALRDGVVVVLVQQGGRPPEWLPAALLVEVGARLQ